MNPEPNAFLSHADLSIGNGQAKNLPRGHEQLNQILKTYTATPMDRTMAGAIASLVSGFE